MKIHAIPMSSINLAPVLLVLSLFALMSFSIGTAEATPSEIETTVLTGRLLDVANRPYAEVSFDLTVFLTSTKSSSARGNSLRTDAEGRFSFVLTARPPKGGHRSIEIGSDYRSEESEQRFGSACVTIDLTEEMASEEIDLGDLVLIDPGSMEYLHVLNDDELLARYREVLHLASIRYYERQNVEACLFEMALRAGEVWIPFLVGAYELQLARENAGESYLPGPSAFEYLVALRRAQGRVDPLGIDIEADLPFDATLLEPISIACNLVNQDELKETFRIPRGGSYRSGRFARCRIEGIGPDGEALDPITKFGMMGGGMYSYLEYQAGSKEPFTLRPVDYVKIDAPGLYQLRVLYHSDVDIADEESIEGWIIATSQTFTMKVTMPELEISAVKSAKCAEWIRAIDTSQPVLLVSGHWHTGMHFRETVGGPEDKLFRAGFAAVPALIDSLETPKMTAKHRAWILGMLWNITGLHNPTSGVNQGAIGRYEWAANWPSSNEFARQNLNEMGSGQGEPAGSKQAPLVAAWLTLRSCYVVKEPAETK